MRKINDSKGNLLCIVYKDEDWVEGLNLLLTTVYLFK